MQTPIAHGVQARAVPNSALPAPASRAFSQVGQVEQIRATSLLPQDQRSARESATPKGVKRSFADAGLQCVAEASIGHNYRTSESVEAHLEVLLRENCDQVRLIHELELLAELWRHGKMPALSRRGHIFLCCFSMRLLFLLKLAPKEDLGRVFAFLKFRIDGVPDPCSGCRQNGLKALSPSVRGVILYAISLRFLTIHRQLSYFLILDSDKRHIELFPEALIALKGFLDETLIRLQHLAKISLLGSEEEIYRTFRVFTFVLESAEWPVVYLEKHIIECLSLYKRVIEGYSNSEIHLHSAVQKGAAMVHIAGALPQCTPLIADEIASLVAALADTPFAPVDLSLCSVMVLPGLAKVQIQFALTLTAKLRSRIDQLLVSSHNIAKIIYLLGVSEEPAAGDYMKLVRSRINGMTPAPNWPELTQIDDSMHEQGVAIFTAFGLMAKQEKLVLSAADHAHLMRLVTGFCSWPLGLTLDWYGGLFLDAFAQLMAYKPDFLEVPFTPFNKEVLSRHYVSRLSCLLANCFKNHFWNLESEKEAAYSIVASAARFVTLPDCHTALIQEGFGRATRYDQRDLLRSSYYNCLRCADLTGAKEWVKEGRPSAEELLLHLRGMAILIPLLPPQTAEQMEIILEVLDKVRLGLPSYLKDGMEMIANIFDDLRERAKAGPEWEDVAGKLEEFEKKLQKGLRPLLVRLQGRQRGERTRLPD